MHRLPPVYLMVFLALILAACTAGTPAATPTVPKSSISQPSTAVAPTVTIVPTADASEAARRRTATALAPTASSATLAPSTCHVTPQNRPDPICTPGATNPAVTQATISTTICVSGYTGTIRPPVTYTNPLKAQQMKEYGFTDAISLHEEDHLIPLELGGNPTSPLNLWPQPYAPTPGAHEKDLIENYLKSQVCSNAMTLTDAQHAITSDWTAVHADVTKRGVDLGSYTDEDDNG